MRGSTITTENSSIADARAAVQTLDRINHELLDLADRLDQATAQGTDVQCADAIAEHARAAAAAADTALTLARNALNIATRDA